MSFAELEKTASGDTMCFSEIHIALEERASAEQCAWIQKGLLDQLKGMDATEEIDNGRFIAYFIVDLQGLQASSLAAYDFLIIAWILFWVLTSPCSCPSALHVQRKLVMKLIGESADL